MRVLIVYCSDYKGNTEKLAEAFGRKVAADLVNLKKLKEISIEGYDLIGFGSGVYKEDLSPKIYNFINKLNLEGKLVFAFSTSGVGLRLYNKKLVRLLKAKGALCKGSFACKGSFNSREFSENKFFEALSKLAKGHPKDKDLKKAEVFISRLTALKS